MANKTYVAFVDKQGGTTATSYVGNEGELFYDPTTTTLRVSDGSTPGGTVVSGAGGGTTDEFARNTANAAFDEANTKITFSNELAIEANAYVTVAYTDGSTNESVFNAEQGQASISVIESGTPGTRLKVESTKVVIDDTNGSGGPRNLEVYGNVSSNGIVLSANNIITGNQDGIFVSSNNFTWTFYEYGLMKFPILTWGEINAAAEAGQRVFISDSSLEATSANFGEIITGGGANVAPVWSDGSYWRIG